jgi:hypothetical protein
MSSIAFRNDFGKLLKEMGLNGYGIEIGVATGTYSELLLSSTELKKIYFVDPWKEYPMTVYNDCTNCSQKEQDGRYNFVVERLKKFGDRAEIIRKDSIDSLKDFTDEYFDFIYIDANHAYEYVKIDINNWYPKLKKGGVFAGHDYMNAVTRHGVYGVKQAVDEFCKDKNVVPLITGGTRRCPPSWYFVK